MATRADRGRGPVTPHNRIHLPGSPTGAPDPATPTLLTCHDCGHQLVLPMAMFNVAIEQHKRGCLGAEVKAMHEQLNRVIRWQLNSSEAPQ